jgi:hypothetical protein
MIEREQDGEENIFGCKREDVTGDSYLFTRSLTSV